MASSTTRHPALPLDNGTLLIAGKRESVEGHFSRKFLNCLIDQMVVGTIQVGQALLQYWQTFRGNEMRSNTGPAVVKS